MKKFYLFLVAVMGMAVAAEAQSVSFGPRIGVNFATVRAVEGDDDFREEFNDEMEFSTGAQFGAVVNFGISDVFSIQPEVLYSQRGFEANTSLLEDDPMGDISVKFKMNYLEVPVLAKISFGGDKVQGFVTAGPTVSYWMNGKLKTSFAGEKEEEDIEFQDDYEDGAKQNRLDFGASVGVGMAYRLGAGALNLDVRYGHGLSDMTKYEEDRPSEEPKNAHRTIGVSLAYLFGGK
ncbi:porin family protein [Pontibacter toksunensis]|uniref:Porin family protein n=1 Tax=Pontibacter toksunensis TaxID=1332631 RepID=A0ABW6BU47_9BACT